MKLKHRTLCGWRAAVYEGTKGSEAIKTHAAEQRRQARKDSARSSAAATIPCPHCPSLFQARISLTSHLHTDLTNYPPPPFKDETLDDGRTTLLFLPLSIFSAYLPTLSVTHSCHLSLFFSLLYFLIPFTHPMLICDLYSPPERSLYHLQIYNQLLVVSGVTVVDQGYIHG